MQVILKPFFFVYNFAIKRKILPLFANENEILFRFDLNSQGKSLIFSSLG